MNKWDLKLAVDDEMLRAYNLVQRVRFRLMGHGRRYGTAANADLKNRHIGERCFIVGNGPSIKEQDLTLLRDETTFCCNFFYRHPRIMEIRPTYYAIIDPKLGTGEWPLSMLDEIAAACPGTTLLLNSKWRNDARIAARAERQQVRWLHINQILHKRYRAPIDLSQGIAAGNVAIACLMAAVYMGFRDIYILGVDANGLFLDALNQKSHFYEAKDEQLNLERSLWQCAQGFRGWSALAERFANSPHRIVNLTRGGLLNCWPRRSYEEVMAEREKSPVAAD